MKKELKDYLHLYLGCECEFETDTFTLGGVFNNRIVYSDNADDSGEGVYEIEDVKPRLRPLSDMTEEEVLKMCNIVSPTIFGDFRYKKWTVYKDREWDSTQKNYEVKRGGDSHSFVVDCIDGDILLYEDDSHVDAPYMNFNYRFEYPKMGFDLFGLIEAGLAIDKTTL